MDIKQVLSARVTFFGLSSLGFLFTSSRAKPNACAHARVFHIWENLGVIKLPKTGKKRLKYNFDMNIFPKSLEKP
jgi:hypothetical protein